MLLTIKRLTVLSVPDIHPLFSVFHTRILFSCVRRKLAFTIIAIIIIIIKLLVNLQSLRVIAFLELHCG